MFLAGFPLTVPVQQLDSLDQCYRPFEISYNQ